MASERCGKQRPPHIPGERLGTRCAGELEPALTRQSRNPRTAVKRDGVPPKQTLDRPRRLGPIKRARADEAQLSHRSAP
jgi:hypothetical protein